MCPLQQHYEMRKTAESEGSNKQATWLGAGHVPGLYLSCKVSCQSFLIQHKQCWSGLEVAVLHSMYQHVSFSVFNVSQ